MVRSVTDYELENAAITSLQAMEVDPLTVMPQEVYNMIQGYSDSVGVPWQFFYQPMLTVMAFFAGPNTVVQGYEGYLERVIFWGIVAADPGRRKTGAISIILSAVEKLENECATAVNNRTEEDEGSGEESVS